MRFLLAFSLLLLCVIVNAQSEIRGVILDARNRKPLSNVNVFINNTQLGTITDESGMFSIANILKFNAELVISHISYKTYVVRIDTQTAQPINVLLQLKEALMPEVIAKQSCYRKGTWDEWGSDFLNALIGTMKNAERCKLLNPQDVQFRYCEKEDELLATSKAPLLIENDALGHMIRFTLEEFELNRKKKSSYFKGYAHFENFSHKATAAVERSRRKAYAGSLTHFMRSLYSDSLKENNFLIYNVENKNSGYREHQLDGTALIKGSGPDYKIIFWKDLLRVVYTNGDMEERYWFNGGDNIVLDATKPTSYLSSRSGKSIVVYADGSYNPLPVVNGYWAWGEKLGNLLPADYTP